MQRETIEHLFYGRPEHQRHFTPDFPVVPDVWIEYGKDPRARIEVLLTPHNESAAPTVARALRQRLGKEATGPIAGRVLYNESVVMAVRNTQSLRMSLFVCSTHEPKEALSRRSAKTRNAFVLRCAKREGGTCEARNRGLVLRSAKREKEDLSSVARSA
jgi:hypothetical protein